MLTSIWYLERPCIQLCQGKRSRKVELLSRSSVSGCLFQGSELYNINDSSADDDNVTLCQLHVSWMYDKNDMKYGVNLLSLVGKMVPPTNRE
jgi:hypothetical protein